MSVEEQIRQVIVRNGYICMDEFMRISMSSSSNSYYRAKQPLGENADFITSPEISQMFGEMIGLWCVSMWYKLGKPKPFNLVELGPGRGFLMRDLLRSTTKVQEFHAAMQLQLLDINELLIEQQKHNLNSALPKIEWISSIYQIANIPAVIIANEFFDALPIKQYIKVKKEWKEVVLIIDPKSGHLKFDHMALMTSIMTTQLALDHPNAGDGAVVEESKESINIIQVIADHIKKYSGAALIIDYGYDVQTSKRQKAQYHRTLQAVKNHGFTSILESLGAADLSAHVDFNALKIAAKGHGAKVAITQQGMFLRDLGIDLRLQELQKQNADLAEILTKQHARLTSKDQMGSLFKVMEVI